MFWLLLFNYVFECYVGFIWVVHLFLAVLLYVYFAFHVSLFLCSYYPQVARWSSHERFGPEFMALLQEFHEEHGMPEDMAKNQERTPNKKHEREHGWARRSSQWRHRLSVRHGATTCPTDATT